MLTTSARSRADDVDARVEQRFGLSSNLIREMVLSPPVAEIYLYGQAAMTRASLTIPEQHAVQLAISAYNACHYGTVAHMSAGRVAGISEEDLRAIKYSELPKGGRLQVLITATRLILEMHGWLTQNDERRLLEQGVGRDQLYEIIALIGLTFISNYVNHLAHTQVDRQFSA